MISEPTPNIVSPYEKVDQTAEKNPTEKDPVREKATATIMEDAVPVHRLPALHSEIIYTLSKDSNYLISGRSSNGLWMALSIPDLPDERGWILTRYLAVVGAITDIEITNVPEPAPEIIWEVATIVLVDSESTEEQDRLHVRIGPEPYARIVGYVENGETYPVLKRTEDGLWLQIPGAETTPTDNPVGGWIATSYAMIGEQYLNPRLAPVQFTTQLSSDKTMININVPENDRLMVRNAPRSDGEVTGYVSQGESYRMLDQSEENAWILIEGGRTESHPYSGWVSGQFVSIQYPELIYRPLVAYSSFSAPRDSEPIIQSGAPVLPTPTSEAIISTEVISESVPSNVIVPNATYRTITPLAGSIRLAGKLLLNVRYAPTPQSAIIGYIYNNEAIDIRGYTADGQWYLVAGQAQTANPHGGWIASDLIKLQDGILNFQTLFSKEALQRNMSMILDVGELDSTLFSYSDKYRYAVINTGGLPLRIRSEPSRTSATLAFAQKGELYIISNYTSDGLWISIGDFENRWLGWTAAEYLILIE